MRTGRDRERVYEPVFIKDLPEERPATRNLLIASDGPIAAANCESGTIRLNYESDTRTSPDAACSLQLREVPVRAYVTAAREQSQNSVYDYYNG